MNNRELEPADKLKSDLEKLLDLAFAHRSLGHEQTEIQLRAKTLKLVWSRRLTQGRAVSLASNPASQHEVNEKFDQIEAGIEKAVADICAGKETDLEFTIGLRSEKHLLSLDNRKERSEPIQTPHSNSSEKDNEIEL